MTKEELNEHINDIRLWTTGVPISTIVDWLKDIRDNGVGEKHNTRLGCKVRLGKYKDKPFYIKSVKENWEWGKPSDIEIHGTTDEGFAYISSDAAEVVARVFSKAKVVNDDD